MSYREQFERGIAEFNEGLYFECHDTFEELWKDERGERKRFLQALIQGAVGIFHATRGNFNGAISQLTKALDKFAEYPDTYLGVDASALRSGLGSLRSDIQERMERGTPGYDPALAPTIGYRFDPETMPDP